MPWWLPGVCAILGTVFGYVVCLGATWMRVHQQESHLRALSTDIGVMVDMHDEVPAEWILDRLESIVAQDYR